MNTLKIAFIYISFIISPIVFSQALVEFAAHTQAKAEEVNANFEALLAEIQSLRKRIIELENNSVVALDKKLKLSGDTILFTGVNVQVVNGTNQTDLSNGLGNLIVGYNEPLGNLDEDEGRCSLSQYRTQSSCGSNGGIWDKQHTFGSHNIVAGQGNSYMGTGGIVFGEYNVVDFQNSSVLGGKNNFATGLHAVVAGGGGNKAIGQNSIVGGGLFNIASGLHASVSGGRYNEASGSSSSIGGGENNTALSVGSSVSGGKENMAEGTHSSIAGGRLNIASGNTASVSGGFSSIASGLYSSVSGGQDNEASGNSSSVSGGLSDEASGNYDWAAGDDYYSED